MSHKTGCTATATIIYCEGRMAAELAGRLIITCICRTRSVLRAAEAINNRGASNHITEDLERPSSEASDKGCSELSWTSTCVREQGRRTLREFRVTDTLYHFSDRNLASQRLFISSHFSTGALFYKSLVQWFWCYYIFLIKLTAWMIKTLIKSANLRFTNQN